MDYTDRRLFVELCKRASDIGRKQSVYINSEPLLPENATLCGVSKSRSLDVFADKSGMGGDRRQKVAEFFPNGRVRLMQEDYDGTVVTGAFLASLIWPMATFDFEMRTGPRRKLRFLFAAGVVEHQTI